jgi:NAD(P)-dependent dehydrogenase (short-subunit alcohol dehydrogenase family)
MWKVDNKVVLITGASRGLGRALALGFAEQGARVAICSRDERRLSEVAEAIRGDVLATRVDITRPEEVSRWILQALHRFGRIDALINNASMLGLRSPVVDYPVDLWRRVVDVALNGQFIVTQQVLPAMLEAGGGSIVNVSSGVTVAGRPEWGAYLVAKWGLEGFTKMLAAEVKEQGVRVNSVDPGGMATEMRAKAYPDEDRSKLKSPEEVLPVFLYLVSDDSRDVTGQRFKAQEFAPEGPSAVR